jgi:hypothetical protein
MTSTEAEASQLRESGLRKAEARTVVACGFCRRRLGGEFFFTCRTCDASYCYIHTSRHQPPNCARQVRRNKREGAVACERGREEGLFAEAAASLIKAGSKPRGASSANV